MTPLRTLLVVIAIGFCTPTFAQQRSPNPGAPGVLRQWPVSGNWVTFLTRSATTHQLACIVATGYRDPLADEQYYWGILRTTSELRVVITDENPNALAGSSILVAIDDSTVANYSIIDRRSFGAKTIIGATVGDAELLIRLLRLGGSLKFITGSSTYSASLAGAKQATTYMDECLEEVAQLDRVPDRASTEPKASPVGGNNDPDWTKGLWWGISNRGKADACNAPPPDITQEADWKLGCRSGQRRH